MVFSHTLFNAEQEFMLIFTILAAPLEKEMQSEAFLVPGPFTTAGIFQNPPAFLSLCPSFVPIFGHFMAKYNYVFSWKCPH